MAGAAAHHSELLELVNSLTYGPTFSMSDPETKQLFADYVAPTYGRYDLVLERGEGVRVWDERGKCYLDFGAGIETCALPIRSEEHTSELQSHLNLVCRLLLEKKKKKNRRGQKRQRKTGTERRHNKGQTEVQAVHSVRIRAAAQRRHDRWLAPDLNRGVELVVTPE